MYFRFGAYGRNTDPDYDPELEAALAAAATRRNLPPTTPVLVDPTTGFVTAAGAAAGLVNTPSGGIAAGVQTPAGMIVAVPPTPAVPAQIIVTPSGPIVIPPQPEKPAMIVNVDTQTQVIVVPPPPDAPPNTPPTVIQGPPVVFTPPTPLPPEGRQNEAGLPTVLPPAPSGGPATVAPIIGVTAQGRPVAAPSSGVFAKAMLGAGAGLLFGPGGAVLGFAAGLAAGLITKPKGSV